MLSKKRIEEIIDKKAQALYKSDIFDHTHTINFDELAEALYSAQSEEGINLPGAPGTGLPLEPPKEENNPKCPPSKEEIEEIIFSLGIQDQYQLLLPKNSIGIIAKALYKAYNEDCSEGCPFCEKIKIDKSFNEEK